MRSYEAKAILVEATNTLDMKLHPTKSKFFTINTRDRESFHIGNTEVAYTEIYTYLQYRLTGSLLLFKYVKYIRLKLEAPSVNIRACLAALGTHIGVCILRKKSYFIRSEVIWVTYMTLWNKCM